MDEMHSTIQRVPAGLLELMGMRGTGQNPQHFLDNVRGTIDLRQLYALSVLSTEFAGFTTGAAGTVATVTVPDGQSWILVHALAIGRVDGVATTKLNASLSLDLGRGSLLTVATGTLQNGDNSALADNETCHVPFFAPYPVLMSPGGRVNATLQNLVGGVQGDIAIQAVFGLLT